MKHSYKNRWGCSHIAPPFCRLWKSLCCRNAKFKTKRFARALPKLLSIVVISLVMGRSRSRSPRKKSSRKRSRSRERKRRRHSSSSSDSDHKRRRNKTYVCVLFLKALTVFCFLPKEAQVK